jgi:hypothetical protein
MSSITPETIEKILELAKPPIVEVDGRTYSTIPLRLVEEPDEPLRNVPAKKDVSSLDALVALIQREAIKLYPESCLFLNCKAFDKVSVYTDVFTDRWERQELYTANATDVPGWRDAWFNYESAVIALRSRFVPGDGTAYLLDLLAKMSNQSSVETNDNGMTQQTTVKRGIMLVGKETIQPIVPLRPYRTFQEVVQPESEFLIRIREGRDENEIGILESDGGMWKLDARNTVKEYLQDRLSDEIEAGTVVLTL